MNNQKPKQKSDTRIETKTTVNGHDAKPGLSESEVS
jgi:hypothetical protein